jgi:hypothetical protein
LSGGEIVAQGTPEDVAKVARSYTGQYLIESRSVMPRSGRFRRTISRGKSIGASGD